METYHHSGDGHVKHSLPPFHRCGDGKYFTKAVKCGAMKHPNRILELREKRGLSLQALADLANSSPQQINRLERGERRLSDHWMDRLAPHLGVEPWELMVEAPKPDDEVAELMRIFNDLDDDRRARLKANALDLLDAQRARERAEGDKDDQPR